MASSDQTVLRYIKEVTAGTTPTTPALKQLRYTSESLKYNISNTKTAEIVPTRVETDLIQTSSNAAGDINFELSYTSFDDWLEAALCGTWTADTGDQFNLDNGQVLRSWAVQKHFVDMTTPQFHMYNGCVIDGLKLQMDVGKIITGAFSLTGFGATVSTTQVTGATFPAVSTTTPMNAVTNLQNFSIGGVPYTGCISALSIDIKNGVRPRMCVGSIKPTAMSLGKLEISGRMEFYFTEGSNFATFVAGSEFAIAFDIVDPAGNKYLFTIPRAKFETGEVVAGGTNSDVMFSATWRALYDGVATRVMRITRDPV